MILLVLFVVIPLLELAVLIRVGVAIGALTTIMICVITGIVGAQLARSEGLRTLSRFQERAARGEIPQKEIADGMAILLAGGMLLTPGFLTDALGLALLIPPSRRGLIRTFASALKRAGVQGESRRGVRMQVWRSHPAEGERRDEPASSKDDAIDVDFEVKEDPRQ